MRVLHETADPPPQADRDLLALLQSALAPADAPLLPPAEAIAEQRNLVAAASRHRAALQRPRLVLPGRAARRLAIATAVASGSLGAWSATAFATASVPGPATVAQSIFDGGNRRAEDQARHAIDDLRAILSTPADPATPARAQQAAAVVRGRIALVGLGHRQALAAAAQPLLARADALAIAASRPPVLPGGTSSGIDDGAHDASSRSGPSKAGEADGEGGAAPSRPSPDSPPTSPAAGSDRGGDGSPSTATPATGDDRSGTPTSPPATAAPSSTESPSPTSSTTSGSGSGDSGGSDGVTTSGGGGSDTGSGGGGTDGGSGGTSSGG